MQTRNVGVIIQMLIKLHMWITIATLSIKPIRLEQALNSKK